MARFQVMLDVDEVVCPFRRCIATIARGIEPALPEGFEETYLASRVIYLYQFDSPCLLENIKFITYV